MVLNQPLGIYGFMVFPLPVDNYGQKKDWMDIFIFKNWFKTKFTPGLTLLDNQRSSHQSIVSDGQCIFSLKYLDTKELCSQNELIKAIFLPANTIYCLDSTYGSRGIV